MQPAQEPPAQAHNDSHPQDAHRPKLGKTALVLRISKEGFRNTGQRQRQPLAIHPSAAHDHIDRQGGGQNQGNQRPPCGQHPRPIKNGNTGFQQETQPLKAEKIIRTRDQACALAQRQLLILGCWNGRYPAVNRFQRRHIENLGIFDFHPAISGKTEFQIHSGGGVETEELKPVKPHGHKALGVHFVNLGQLPGADDFLGIFTTRFLHPEKIVGARIEFFRLGLKINHVRLSGHYSFSRR